MRWQIADAQALPFADGEFDAVLSCIGAMFAQDHATTARELLRVCRPGGTVVMANWTPGGGVGRFFRLLGRYGPPQADGPSPTAWGDPRHVAALFAGAEVQTELRTVRLRFTGPPAEVTAYYRQHFAPVIATFAGLDPDRAAALERELIDLYAAEDSGPAGGPSCYELEYLLVRVRVPAGRRPAVRPVPARPPAVAPRAVRRRAPGRRGAPSAARPASGRPRAR